MLALPHPFFIKTDKVCSYAFCISVPSSKLEWCGVWGRATTHDMFGVELLPMIKKELKNG